MIGLVVGLWILSGVATGWLGNRWSSDSALFGTFAFITMGVAGAIMGGWLIIALFDESQGSVMLWSILAALAGALLLVGLLYLLAHSGDRL